MIKREKIAVVSGCYDPLSPSELAFLKICKSKSDWLVVGLNSDYGVLMKTGVCAFNYQTRRRLLDSIECVDEIFQFNDSDGTAIQLLKLVKACYPNAQIFYVSEENMEDTPETKVRGVTFVTMRQE
jgi:bifunctional ADP-heptose synthase (sugar kinase/adenylyltransferase)